MSNPLAGTGGKPLIGRETPTQHFVGRVIVELFEGPDITSDANGLVFSIGAGLDADIDDEELLRRISAALPLRIPKLAAAFERKRQMEKAMAGPNPPHFKSDPIRIDSWKEGE